MPRDRYEPLKLNQTNRYAGYQFHARVRVEGMDSFAAFRFLILSVCDWVKKRIPEEDGKAPELSLPEAERYAEAETDCFVPYHFSIGYSLDITPLLYEGIWSLRLKEPDGGIEGVRDAVPGRFFTTRVGLRMNEKGYTELGIRIDVTDPADVDREVDFAFRPGFVRSLAVQPSVSFEQARKMKYGQAEQIRTDEDYKRLLYMLENEDNQLPVIVFTHAWPGEKKPAEKPSMEEFLRSESAKSLLRFSGVGSFSVPQAPAEAQPPEMPYNADSFSKSAFGYGITCVLDDRFTEKFRNRIRREFNPGDILVCGPRKFRGGVAVIDYPGKKEAPLQKAYERALLAAQSYLKHKAPYFYGTVIFEAEARKLAQERELQRILESGTMEEKERYARLVRHAEELTEVIRGKDEKIDRLQKQCDEEFDRGIAFRDEENARLEEENNSLKKGLLDEQEKNRRMLSEHQRAKDVLDALEQIRKVEKLPEDNAGVVRYFKQVYPDRLGFTERGEWEASRCALRTGHLWEVLYMAANDLVDLFREKEENLTEEDVTRAAGCEMSFKEGSTTRKDADLMRLRDDEYEGKAISVEPHLKLKSAKGEPEHQRLHFCYDPELKKIIIGYLGDHLDSAATRYAKKR